MRYSFNNNGNGSPLSILFLGTVLFSALASAAPVANAGSNSIIIARDAFPSINENLIARGKPAPISKTEHAGGLSPAPGKKAEKPLPPMPHTPGGTNSLTNKVVHGSEKPPKGHGQNPPPVPALPGKKMADNPHRNTFGGHKA